MGEGIQPIEKETGKTVNLKKLSSQHFIRISELISSEERATLVLKKTAQNEHQWNWTPFVDFLIEKISGSLVQKKYVFFSAQDLIDEFGIPPHTLIDLLKGRYVQFKKFKKKEFQKFYPTTGTEEAMQSYWYVVTGINNSHLLAEQQDHIFYLTAWAYHLLFGHLKKHYPDTYVSDPSTLECYQDLEMEIPHKTPSGKETTIKVPLILELYNQGVDIGKLQIIHPELFEIHCFKISNEPNNATILSGDFIERGYVIQRQIMLERRKGAVGDLFAEITLNFTYTINALLHSNTMLAPLIRRAKLFKGVPKNRWAKVKSIVSVTKMPDQRSVSSQYLINNILTKWNATVNQQQLEQDLKNQAKRLK